MKVAIVSPLPPASSGIADYTSDVVRALLGAHTIELFHDQERVSDSLPVPVFRIAELPGRAAAASPFDAVLYQMGNAPAHDFMYEWMERVPGIVVLHDLVLHHSYARRFLESTESRAYAADPSSREKRQRAEEQHASYLAAIETSYPGQGERLKDAHFNSTGDLLPYAYPLFEPSLAHAKAVGAHNSFMVDALQAARPDLPCFKLSMPMQAEAAVPERMASLRARLGLSEEDRVVGCFGLITREKRVETVARAIARIAQIHPRVRLLLAGPVADRPWLMSLLERTGIAPRAVVAGRLDGDDFSAAIALSDAVAHLRYPTARETSAALLRVMAQGRPVIISDLANQSEIPADAVRRVDPCDEEGDLTRAVDWILRNSAAAEAMGERARRYVAVEHSQEKARESYERLLKGAAPLYSEPHP